MVLALASRLGVPGQRWTDPLLARRAVDYAVHTGRLVAV